MRLFRRGKWKSVAPDLAYWKPSMFAKPASPAQQIKDDLQGLVPASFWKTPEGQKMLREAQ